MSIFNPRYTVYLRQNAGQLEFASESDEAIEFVESLPKEELRDIAIVAIDEKGFWRVCGNAEIFFKWVG